MYQWSFSALMIVQQRILPLEDIISLSSIVLQFQQSQLSVLCLFCLLLAEREGCSFMQDWLLHGTTSTLFVQVGNPWVMNIKRLNRYLYMIIRNGTDIKPLQIKRRFSYGEEINISIKNIRYTIIFFLYSFCVHIWIMWWWNNTAFFFLSKQKQAVSKFRVIRQPLAAEFLVQFQANPYGICSGKSDTGEETSSISMVFPCHYQHTNNPHFIFIHLCNVNIRRQR